MVVPKQNPGDNFIDVDDAAFLGLMEASKKVAAALRKAFDIYRVGLVIEGEAVPHLHVKLIPMHGVGRQSSDQRHDLAFSEAYQGFLTTIEGPKMSDERLQEIQAKIQKAAAS